MGTLVFQANLGGAVNLVGPNTASTVNFTLPSADGSSGQALVTNGSGTLSFSSFVSAAAGSNTQVQFNSSGAFAGSANLTFNGTTLTAANTSVTTSETLSYGTANGVAYLNGSKVVTTGSALTFDGTNLSLTTAGAIYKVPNAGGSIFSAGGNDGVYIDGTSHYVATYANGSEAMRLTSTGLGIGTSSPAYKLDVAGPVQSSAGYYINGNTNGGYIWVRDNYALRFGTNDTERMRLDSSGNLGLGVTPSAWAYSGVVAMQIKNAGFWGYANRAAVTANGYINSIGGYTYIASDFATNYQQINGTHTWSIAPSGTAGNAITFTQAMTLDASGNLGIGTTTTSPYRLNVLRSDGKAAFMTDGSTADFAVTCISGVSMVAAASTGVLALGTSGTERARIDSGGNLLVGTTSQPNGGFTSRIAAVQPNANALASMDATNASGGWGIIMRYTASSPNGTGNEAFSFQDSSAVRFAARSNGGLANYSANDVNLSDRREKTNFAPAKSYLDTICAIPVQTFNYIDQSEDDPGLTLGVVAQDVQSVAPELVMESNWGTEENPKMRLSIYQTDLQYALMKCIQEQQALITQLTERITALESK